MLRNNPRKEIIIIHRYEKPPHHEYQPPKQCHRCGAPIQPQYTLCFTCNKLTEESRQFMQEMRRNQK